MGRRSEILEIVTHLPSVAEIQGSLGELACDISFDGSLELTSEDEARLKTWKPKGMSFPFRSNHVDCRYRREVLKKKRGISHARISASLSGDKLFLSGNNYRLMDALVDGLIASGHARRMSP
jgi:hypothetical protein